MVIRFGEFEFDGDAHRLRRGGNEVRLDAKAFNLLGILLSRRPAVVPRKELHERLWPHTFVTGANLSSVVSQLREGARRDDAAATHMAVHTLEQMANGGINDHLGGGFCRYSVDQFWMIPHFEKMLYDNGQLLAVYAEAWIAADRRPLFRHVCERTAEWVMREMQAPDGGYYASLDADSDGEEGRFYVWTPAEVAALLDEDEFQVFAPRFGLDRGANFEGRWHLHTFADTAAIAEQSGREPRAVRGLLLSARNKLLAEREKRVRQGRDEKILTSWNALMIKGMAKAGRLLDRPEWVDSAVRALAFLR